MDPADFYSGIVIDAYQSLRSTSFDPVPYSRFVARWGEPGLEIGCGTGEPLLDLRAAGLDVDGVDSSVDMVTRCCEVASARGVSVVVFHQREELLDLPRRYRSVYLAGPTFNLLVDDETAEQALRSIGRHLTDDGAALIPLWVPAPTPEADLGVTRSADVGDGVEVRYTPTAEVHDRVSRTRTTRTRYERITVDGTQTADREWIIHWHTPGSFTSLCERTGLGVQSLVDDRTGRAASVDSVSSTAVLRRR